MKKVQKIIYDPSLIGSQIAEMKDAIRPCTPSRQIHMKGSSGSWQGMALGQTHLLPAK